MRAILSLAALLSSLLLFLCLAWLSGDASGRGRNWEEEKEVQARTESSPRVVRSPRSPSASVQLAPPLANNRNRTTPNQTGIRKTEQASKCKEMWNNNWSSSLKKKRYSEDYYLQIVEKLQNCTWNKRPQEYVKFRILNFYRDLALTTHQRLVSALIFQCIQESRLFSLESHSVPYVFSVYERSELAACCDAAHNFITSQNNTPLGSNMSYEVDNKKTIHITEEIFRMLPESQPLNYPFKHCAVVGNGGILQQSNCGAEIDKSDFVFRCNLPPTEGSVSQDVGNKTNLVTVNPSIITQKYNKLNEKKATFLEKIATYGEAFLLLPAFSFRSNTAASFKVHHTLREFSAKQKAIFFYPKYLKNLAQFWRTKGVKAYRLSSGFMITSAAMELCENVKLYGFWPFSKSIGGAPISHHYYDNQLPKPGFHAMPKEYNQILQLHGRGILKLQFDKCLYD